MDGDDLIIEADMNIILDIPASEAPKLTSLEINGRLTFEKDADRELKAYKIWVRAGELYIGTEEEPFNALATITLLGDNTEQYWSFTSAIEAGNKGLVVTGDVYMYGSLAAISANEQELITQTRSRLM